MTGPEKFNRLYILAGQPGSGRRKAGRRIFDMGGEATAEIANPPSLTLRRDKSAFADATARQVRLRWRYGATSPPSSRRAGLRRDKRNELKYGNDGAGESG